MKKRPLGLCPPEFLQFFELAWFF